MSPRWQDAPETDKKQASATYIVMKMMAATNRFVTFETWWTVAADLCSKLVRRAVQPIKILPSNLRTRKRVLPTNNIDKNIRKALLDHVEGTGYICMQSAFSTQGGVPFNSRK
jgi:hypothetical protein